MQEHELKSSVKMMKMMFVSFDLAHVPHHFYCRLMKLGGCSALDAMNIDPLAEIAGDGLLIYGSKVGIMDGQHAIKAPKTSQNRKTERLCSFFLLEKVRGLLGQFISDLGWEDNEEKGN